ncbi:MAG: pentapeptide repeat-containing protein [Hyphomicrobiales bacterium]
MTDPQNSGLSIEDWRNLVLIGAAVIALPLAIWRSWIAHKQIRLSEAGQNLDRYQKSAAMLGDDKLSVRIAGVLALQDLAEISRVSYSVKVQIILASFIRDRSLVSVKDTDEPQNNTRKTKLTTDKDIRSAIHTIGLCRTHYMSSRPPDMQGLEGPILMLIGSKKLVFSVPLDLQNTNLVGANFSHFNWQNTNFAYANMREALLSNSNLYDADFSLADLSGSDLSNSDLTSSDLSYANFAGADISSANFKHADLTKARNLTIQQLETAINVDPKWLKIAENSED